MSLPSPQPGALRQQRSRSLPDKSLSSPPSSTTSTSSCASGSSSTCTQTSPPSTATTSSCTSGSSPTRTPSTGSGSDTSDGSTTATPDSTSSTTIHSTTSTVSTTTVSTASSSPAVPSLSSSPTPNNRAATHTNPNTGAIAGGVVGGAVFLACVIVAGILYFRRKRRMAPSAEFMDSVHKGAPPIFRLRSGAEYTASTPDHVGSLPGTPIPFPFMQDPYKDHKIPGMALPDSSARKSLPPPPRPPFSDYDYHHFHSVYEPPEEGVVSGVPSARQGVEDSRPPFSDYHHFHSVYEAPEEGVVSGVPSAWQGVEDSHYEPYLQDSYMNPDVADTTAPPEDMRPHTSSGSGHHTKDNSSIALIPVRRSVDVP